MPTIYTTLRGYESGAIAWLLDEFLQVLPVPRPVTSCHDLLFKLTDQQRRYGCFAGSHSTADIVMTGNPVVIKR